ncbi:hypothetical protein CHU00_17845 [Sphingobacterium cellulitidis]|nr:hypothetical protein CHU00_17845 [Sphingobacterium cellulitidis]
MKIIELADMDNEKANGLEFPGNPTHSLCSSAYYQKLRTMEMYHNDTVKLVIVIELSPSPS